MRLLSFAEKRAVARAMWRMLRMGTSGRARWEGRTFAEFLRETAQPERAVHLFWSPVVVSACNLDVDEASAASAMQVFQEGFLASPDAPVMGLSAVPLVRLYDPAEQAIAAAGGTLRLGVSARALAFDGRRVTGVVTDEGMVDADVTVHMPGGQISIGIGPDYSIVMTGPTTPVGIFEMHPGVPDQDVAL